MKQKMSTKLIATGCATVLFATPAFSSVHAMEKTINEKKDNQMLFLENVRGESVEQDIEDVSEYFGFTETERQEFANNVRIAKSGNRQRMGGTAIAIKLSKAWFKLPHSVQAKIATFGGLSYAMNILNTLTGAVENMLYTCFTKMGMNSTVAWWATKACLLLM